MSLKLLLLFSMSRILTGIQSTGTPHLGNILGAIIPAIEESKKNKDSYLFIADLHSLTQIKDPAELSENTYSTAAAWLAFGLDSSKTIFYKQSDIPTTTELSWVLSSLFPYQRLTLAHSFKDKSNQLKDVNVGLFTYPMLMAADILLYDANIVPVGKDQLQHLEITRDVAIKFNNKYGEVFPLPEKSSGKSGARLMSLKHPDSKMSKSSDDINGTIYFDDDKDTIMKKFKSSVTDSDDSIQYNLSEKKGISNLIDIYASINEMSHKEVEKTFTDSRYGEFKMAVGECVAEYLNPINLKFTELEKENISEVVEINLQEAQDSAELTIQEVNNILGL